jgi:hypothetical protein
MVDAACSPRVPSMQVDQSMAVSRSPVLPLALHVDVHRVGIKCVSDNEPYSPRRYPIIRFVSFTLL